MKTNIIALIATVFIVGILMASCGEESKQDRQEVKEDVKVLGKDLKEGTVHAAQEVEVKVTEEWYKFKTASENSIQRTEKEIENLRERVAKATDKEKEILTEKLNALEQKNEELKEKLVERTEKFKANRVEFNHEAVERQKSFEREFRHDMDELGTALKDLFKDNVE